MIQKQELQHFDKPVLILHGAEDVVRREIPETAQRILPNSELLILERCKHYGWLDRPDQYFGAINDFLHTINRSKKKSNR
ncbi:MAG: alpha/beta hydrolase [Fodinibius sp.]|nr:alpha/beta hydrolase [Fodinibius sp.]